MCGARFWRVAITADGRRSRRADSLTVLRRRRRCLEPRRRVSGFSRSRQHRHNLVRFDFSYVVPRHRFESLADHQRDTELIRRLDGHLGFVKGVVFDPVGQYLASLVRRCESFIRGARHADVGSFSQSDDNTLKIWRTSDWRLHASVSEPFVDAPKTTVTRLT